MFNLKSKNVDMVIFANVNSENISKVLVLAGYTLLGVGIMLGQNNDRFRSVSKDPAAIQHIQDLHGEFLGVSKKIKLL